MSDTDPRITFFPKRKIRVEVTGWTPKHNAQGEKRVRIDFMLPLSDEARDGIIPAWLINPLNSFEQEGSVESKTKLDVTLEGVTLEFWDTPKSMDRIELLTAATLGDFYLERVTKDKQTFLALTFNTSIKRSWQLLKWCDKYEDCYVWAEFTPTDPQMPSKPVPGAQMTIADAEPAEEKEQTPEEAVKNLEKFSGRGKVPKEQIDKAIAEANEANAKSIEKAKKQKDDDSPRRPRGFSRTTQQGVN